jgi:hypothetical protein
VCCSGILVPRFKQRDYSKNCNSCGYIKEHPDFKEVGERMLQEWVKGQQLSLQGG